MAELTLHRVSYRYPRAARDALQGVECRFRAGEVAAVVGPSASPGKTTLLSIMAGLDRPSGGEVLVDGKKTQRDGSGRLPAQYVSVIFQAFHLFPAPDRAGKCVLPPGAAGRRRKGAREQARGTSSWWASRKRSTGATRASSRAASSSAWR